MTGQSVVTKTKKAARTRTRILDSAMKLLRELGYEATTMRAIAKDAGVSLGNAYYYFPSKESLVQAFYSRSFEEHIELAVPLLEQENDFKSRLRGVIRTKIDTSMVYHQFASILFRTAADPASPLSPFSIESKPVRDQNIELFEKVIDGSDVRVPARLRSMLPRLLWLYEMGIILFWVHDRSPQARRSYLLIDASTDLIVRLISLASNPLLRPALTRFVVAIEDLIESLSGEQPSHEAGAS